MTSSNKTYVLIRKVKKMGSLILGITIAVEIFFMIWTIVTKDNHSLEKVVVRAGSVVLLVLLMIFGALSGVFRYGMFILVLALQAGIGYLIIRKKKEKEFCVGRQVAKLFGNSILYVLLLFIAILLPQHKEPVVTGDHEVAIKEYTWVDESRVETYTNTGENRAITIKVWYPKEEGTYPLVVFSHGSFGVVDSNTSTCTELASNGYVAVSIAHPYQAAYVKDMNGKVTIVSQDFMNEVYNDNGDNSPQGEERNYHEAQNWLTIRKGDENFVLDTILDKVQNGGEEPFDRIDVEKIGLFGHSLGGSSSVALGRERSDIDAVINLEGTMTGEYLGFENGSYIYNDDPYPIPLMDVNSREIYDQAMELPELIGRTYVNFNTGEKAKDFHEVVINGASHLNMTDLGMISPILSRLMVSGTSSSGVATVDPRVCIENVNSIVLNYFDYYLKDSGEWKIQSEY